MADANVEKEIEKEMAPSQEEHSVLDSAQETATATASAECGLDLEAKKQRLLEELESALLPSKVIPKDDDDDDSDKRTVETQQSPIPAGAPMGLGLGLGFEVIDETALVDTLSLPSAAAAAANGFGKGKKGSGANVKNNKQSSSRRRAKKDATMKHKNGNGKNNAAASTEEDEEAPKNNGKKKKNKRRFRYSRKEMEAVRFANVEKQRAFWDAIHAGLEPLVAAEYDTLLAAVAPVPLPLPLCHLPNKKQPAPPILGAACCENMDSELQLMKSSVIGSLVDPSCSHSPKGEDECSILEKCSEDDDSEDDYASIQRPAFLVEGEPNFDSGPPEDGWEYLRRVRWEADQIPRVKVAKLDRSKLNKEQSAYMPKIPDIAKCPDHLLPLKEWEDVFLAEFSTLRANLSCLEGLDAMKSINQPLIHLSKQLGNNLKESASVMNKDVQLDHHLSASEAIGQSHDLISEVNDTTRPPGSITSVDQTCSSSPTLPLLSAIFGMDPVARVSMLLKRISLLEPANEITRNDCMWLFALCATVDAPLDADTSAALRSLLRKCASLRAGKAELDDEVIMLNILATISGRYFGQSEN